VADVEIRGLDKLIRKLSDVKSLRAAKVALKAGALHIKGKIATYPPASEANTPYQRRWYERGYGPKWMRKDGTWRGSKTSETLGRRWTIAERNAGLTQVVGNNVSYVPYVQDPDKQTSFHAARGWKTTGQVVDEEADTVVRFVKAKVDEALRD